MKMKCAGWLLTLFLGIASEEELYQWEYLPHQASRLAPSPLIFLNIAKHGIVFSAMPHVFAY